MNKKKDIFLINKYIFIQIIIKIILDFSLEILMKKFFIKKYEYKIIEQKILFLYHLEKNPSCNIFLPKNIQFPKLYYWISLLKHFSSNFTIINIFKFNENTAFSILSNLRNYDFNEFPISHTLLPINYNIFVFFRIL